MDIEKLITELRGIPRTDRIVACAVAVNGVRLNGDGNDLMILIRECLRLKEDDSILSHPISMQTLELMQVAAYHQTLHFVAQRVSKEDFAKIYPLI